MSRPARGLATALGALSIVAFVIGALHGRDSGVVGSNGVRPFAFVGTLGRKSKVCQPLGTATRTPSAVQLVVGAYGRSPRLLARVVGMRPVVHVPRYRDGVITITLPRGTPRGGAVLCIKNDGYSNLQLAGEAVPVAIVDGNQKQFATSFTLIAPPRVWSQQANAILTRVGHARGGAGGDTTGLIAVCMIAGALLTGLASAFRFPVG